MSERDKAVIEYLQKDLLLKTKANNDLASQLILIGSNARYVRPWAHGIVLEYAFPFPDPRDWDPVSLRWRLSHYPEHCKTARSLRCVHAVEEYDVSCHVRIYVRRDRDPAPLIELLKAWEVERRVLGDDR